MKKSFDNYRFLAGGRRLRGTLWESQDHILYIDPSGFVVPFSERYRRFDFERIESLVVTRTRAGMWQNIVLGLAIGALLTFLWLALLAESVGGAVIWGGLSLPLIGMLIFNLFQGPSCRSVLNTAVGTHTLKPLNRWRDARAVLALVKERAEEAQSGIQVAAATDPDRIASVESRRAGEREPWRSRTLCTVAGILTLMSGVLILGELAMNMPIYTLAMLGVLAASGTAVILSLVRSHGTRAPISLPPALTISLVAILGFGILGLALFLTASSWGWRHSGDSEISTLALVSQMSPGESPWLSWPILLGSGLLDILGLMVLYLCIRNGDTPEPVAPTSAPTNPEPEPSPPTSSDSPTSPDARPPGSDDA